MNILGIIFIVVIAALVALCNIFRLTPVGYDPRCGHRGHWALTRVGGTMRIRRTLAAIGLAAAFGIGTAVVAPTVVPTAAPVVAPVKADAAVAYPAKYCIYFAGDGSGRYWITVGETANSTNWGYLYDNTYQLITSFAPGSATYYGGARHAAWSNMAKYPLVYYSYTPSGSWTSIGPLTYTGLC